MIVDGPPAMLPPLREDLVLAPGAFSGGQPTWTVYDPSSHDYVRIGWLEFEILTRWGMRDPERIARDVSSCTTLSPSADDVSAFAAFAHRAGLVQSTSKEGTEAFAERRRRSRHGPGTWLLHNYLFLRLRLVNPDRFLSATMPWVGWMFSWTFLSVATGAILVSAFLVSRQWNAYSHAVMALVSFKGAVEIAAALTASKVVHELGHGYAARRLGCRVPSMGVAFLVMWPVLWTDTTDAWKLTGRRRRLLIDASGVFAEICLATAATLAWAVLPDGPMRGAALTLSGSTWILTLLVNLNPLMRFDGYYMLSDFLDVANLQDRGFALAKWRLREVLLGLGRPIPERLPSHVALPVLAWAYCTWVYRFSLFLGIALLVYHISFKALGFVLMGIEIWFFLARPILRELHVWVASVARYGMNAHSIMFSACLAGAAVAVCVPWQGHVHAPAVMRSARQSVLYAELPGRLVETSRNGAVVKAGDVPFRMRSIDVEHSLAVATARRNGLEASVRGQAFDKDRLSELAYRVQEVRKSSAEIVADEAKMAALDVTAPFDGVLVDVPPGLRVGSDVPRREPLGMLVDPTAVVVEAFLSEADADRVASGARAVFVPDAGENVDLVLASVSPTPSRRLESPEVASVNGGSVPATKDAQGHASPEGAFYRAVFVPSARTPGTDRRVRGTVSVESERISPARATWRRVVGVVVRETGL